MTAFIMCELMEFLCGMSNRTLEDEDNRSRRNVVIRLPSDAASHPGRTEFSHLRRCENLKTCKSRNVKKKRQSCGVESLCVYYLCVAVGDSEGRFQFLSLHCIDDPLMNEYGALVE